MWKIKEYKIIKVFKLWELVLEEIENNVESCIKLMIWYNDNFLWVRMPHRKRSLPKK